MARRPTRPYPRRRRPGHARRALGIAQAADHRRQQRGKAAARRLSDSLPPVAAAAAAGVLAHPELADEQLEVLDVQGFGDEALSEFAHALVQIRLAAPDLDAAGVRRQLVSLGQGQTLVAITKAAALSGAPFLRADVSPARLRTLWGQLYGALVRLASLERALVAAKADLTDAGVFAEFYGLKAERDALRRDLGAGEIWRGGHVPVSAGQAVASRH